MRVHRPTKRTVIIAASLTLLAAIPLVNAVRTNSASAADAVAGDGTTSATAGASCWGIKQQYATSATGTYWLNSAALGRPQQFWCDMATDGGGWVLVGRGRDGWTFNPLGQGSAATVRGTTDGQGAFAPAALDGDTIDSLLSGQTVDTLTDGIRLERSATSDGRTRQDYRLFPTYKSWTWAFPGGQLLTKVTIDGTTYNGSNTANTANTAYGQTTNGLSGVTGARQLFTTAWTNHNKVQGFSFGSGVKGGSNAATNHLWTYGTEGSPLAFTRVWIRPRVANDAAGFTPLPSAGLPAQPLPAQLKSKSEAAPWGVVGLDHTDEPTIEPYNTTVLSMKVTADRTFVGGRFTGVQNGPSATPVAQAHLAAFDLDGKFIDTFRPTVDGRVWNMVITPDGKLIIAGDFTNVNGVANTAGLAAIDPKTGDVIAGWKANIARSNGSRPLVRALAIRGTTLYAAGTFNRVTAGTWSTITVTNAISLSTANGNPGTWRPRPSASTVDLRVTDDGTRVLLAGYFADVNGDTNQGYFGITDAATGTPSTGIGPWTPSAGSSAKYQQAVLDLGDGRIMVGGSEHDNQVWDTNRTKLIDSTITKQGGDTQALELFDGKVYLGCHCGDWIYQGTNNWSSPTGFRSIEAINLVGAFDAATFEYDTGWYPSGLKGEKGEGIWAIDKDSRGCLWVGGDLVRGAYSGDATADWLGGFARFCPADATAPTPPANLRSAPSGSGATLSWAASTDYSGTVSYDVYRNDRVIATVWGTSYTDPSVTGTQRYTVRAVDARVVAAPAPISVNGPSPKIATAIAFGSTWRYADSGADQGTAWRVATFADSSWKTGPARLGWGTTDLATTFTAKPQTAYLRSSFDVADPSSVRVVEAKLKVATGAVVYVNGTEAGRINMPAGKITSTSPAAAYVSGATETATNTVMVPASMLVAGTNSVAVELHAMTAGATRGFFDLEATTYGSGGDTQAPTAPGVSAAASTGRVDLSWTAATDDTALGGYLIARDGTTIAATGPTAMGYVDGEVDTAVAHTYVVTAYDTNGNTAASGPVTTKSQVNSALLPYGASWRWSFTEAGQAAGWAAPGFDDTTWATGAAELGFGDGDGDEKTVISTAAAPRPLTAYFRTTVTVDDPTAFQTVLAELIRDDGAVVYVNGVEVGRDNMPAGPVTGATKAPVAITDRTAEKTPVSIAIPASAFVPGANTIAVEVHGNDRYTGDLSFDLKLTGRP